MLLPVWGWNMLYRGMAHSMNMNLQIKFVQNRAGLCDVHSWGKYFYLKKRLTETFRSIDCIVLRFLCRLHFYDTADVFVWMY